MTIVIADEYLIFREFIRTLCTRDLGFKVVGETASGAGAIELTLDLKPDVTLLDLELGDGVDGFTVADRVSRTLPSARFLALARHLNAFTLTRVPRSPLHGLIDKKSATITLLREALSAVAQGRSFFSEAFRTARRKRQSDPHWFPKLLSETELQILSLIGGGMSDHEIGAYLGISPKTAQTHRSRILTKLSIRCSAKLVAFAISHGFGRPG